MDNTVYIRLRHKIQAKPNQQIKVGDIAQIVANEQIANEIKPIILHHLNMADQSIVVIDLIHVVKEIRKVNSHFDIETIGPNQTIVEVLFKKRKFRPALFFGVWLLLFFGASLTIMNFHEDVSMREVHQRLFKSITGLADDHPLLLQIPYSIGLGLGMILFFNHVFRKRLNEEPSPLEVEMFNYQQDLDNYVIMHENKESIKKINDD